MEMNLTMENIETIIETQTLGHAGRPRPPLIEAVRAEDWKKEIFNDSPIRISPDHVMAIAHVSNSPFKGMHLYPVKKIRGWFGKYRHIGRDLVIASGRRQMFGKAKLMECKRLLPRGKWYLVNAERFVDPATEDETQVTTFLAVRYDSKEWYLFLAPVMPEDCE
jgi:hypothetical protein